MKALWEQAKNEIANQVHRKDFSSWIEPLEYVSSSNGSLRLKAQNNLMKRWFLENYQEQLTEILQKISGRAIPIFVEAPERPENGQMVFGGGFLKDVKPKVKQKKTSSKLTCRGINEKYTFERFIEGPSNQFARAACQSVAKKPGKAFNPLFLYGGVGLGKTHLINAIGNHIFATKPDTKIVALSAERFMNEMINSIHHSNVRRFRNKYRSCDLLLIDDIHFLAGKERTQEEFFHTFNSLYESGSQIVVTSDRYPKDIPDLEERLRSRFSWGLVADIQPPELETRMAILKEKAEEEEVQLPDDVAFFLASKFVDNVRELEGAFIRLSAFSSFNGNTITMEMTKKVLRNLLGDTDKIITVDVVQKSICDFFKLRMSDLKSARRQKIVAVPRQIGMYLSRKLTDSSFPDIGQQFGGRDHSTVIHACKKIAAQAEKDHQMLQTLEVLEKTIKS